MVDKGLLEKETALIAEIERLLPDFARSCRDSADMVVLHQDSFAADYQDEEYALDPPFRRLRHVTSA